MKFGENIRITEVSKMPEQREKLTEQQQRAYDFIREKVAEQGYPPSVREIGKAIGLSSPSSVHAHIENL